MDCHQWLVRCRAQRHPVTLYPSILLLRAPSVGQNVEDPLLMLLVLVRLLVLAFDATLERESVDPLLLLLVSLAFAFVPTAVESTLISVSRPKKEAHLKKLSPSTCALQLQWESSSASTWTWPERVPVDWILLLVMLQGPDLLLLLLLVLLLLLLLLLLHFVVVAE
jgi:hypothetical protein